MKALLKRLREPLQGASPGAAEEQRPVQPVAARTPFLSRRRLAVVIVVGGTCLLAVVYWLFDSAPGDSSASGINRQARFEVVAGPVTKQLQLTGTLAPREEQTVTAPFEGLVLEKHVSLGQRVSAGEVLAHINTRDVEIRLREAEAALIKAQQQLDKLEDWANSQEANRARRTLAQSQRRLDNLSRRVEQSQQLLEIGIIAEGEYQSELQQLEDQRMDVASAEEALASTLKQGDATEQEVAALELENAKIRANRLRETVAEAVIRAPIDGIVVAAKTSDGGAGGSGGDLGFTVGDQVSEGQALFSVANIEDLIVQSSIDEIDINSVELGQTATVTSDSLPGITMSGRLTKIAYQARTDGRRANFPSFDIELALDTVAPDERLRLGVTVHVAMDIYRNDEAIVVPFEAIGHGSGGAVAYGVTDDGELEQRPVQLGMSFVNGVEVLAGLQAGDVLAFTEASRDTRFPMQ